MKIYFLVTEGVGENFVTIVSEKSLLEMFEQYYRKFYGGQCRILHQ
jgi:hypothetical protein